MRSNRIAWLLLAGLSASVVIAQEDFDPRPVIEGRQAGLRDMGGAFKAIADEFRRSKPSLPTIRLYARQIDDLAKQQKFWFPPGTGPQSGIETAAKPEIWRRPAQFQTGQAAMSEQAAKLVQVAAADDLDAIRSQWRALGRTCKRCHETFRDEDD